MPQTSEEWFQRAEWRRENIDRYLWNESKNLYFDYDTVQEKQILYESVTAFWMLWAGAASDEQCWRLVYVVSFISILLRGADEELASQESFPQEVRGHWRFGIWDRGVKGQDLARPTQSTVGFPVSCLSVSTLTRLTYSIGLFMVTQLCLVRLPLDCALLDI